MKKGKCGPNAYVGRISNSGSQRIEAPVKQISPKVGKVKTGTDLRSK